MLIKGQDFSRIIFGNTLSADRLSGGKFDYMLSNQPFGVEWKKIRRKSRPSTSSSATTGGWRPGSAD